MHAKKKSPSSQVTSNISTLREEAGLTQQQLAVYIGVSTNTIQNWERGTTGVEQFEKILKLCTVLGCELQDLIEYPEDQASKSTAFSLSELRQLRKKWLS